MRYALTIALVGLGLELSASAQNETSVQDLRDLNISVKRISFEFLVPAQELTAKLEQMLKSSSFAHDAIRIAFIDPRLTFEKNKVRIVSSVNVNGVVDLGFFKRRFENQKVKFGATVHFDINNWKLDTSVSDLSLKTGIQMIDVALTVMGGNDFLEPLIKDKFDKQLQNLFAGKSLKDLAHEHIARFQTENSIRQIPRNSDLKVEIVPQGLDVRVHFFDQQEAFE